MIFFSFWNFGVSGCNRYSLYEVTLNKNFEISKQVQKKIKKNGSKCQIWGKIKKNKGKIITLFFQILCKSA
jgi:hypothetical protein